VTKRQSEEVVTLAAAPAEKPPYRLCWWCNRQFWGRSWRKIDAEGGGASFYVHVSCARDAARAIGGTEVGP
jgi:hypothetical protein